MSMSVRHLGASWAPTTVFPVSALRGRRQWISALVKAQSRPSSP
jgi:hypothetical protein